MNFPTTQEELERILRMYFWIGVGSGIAATVIVVCGALLALFY